MPADGRPAADSIVARSANALNIDASTLRPTWPTSGGRGAAATAVATLASAKVRPHRRTESQVHVESTKVLKYTSALHCTALLHFRTALCEASTRCAASRYAVTAFANTRQRHGSLPAAPSPLLLSQPAPRRASAELGAPRAVSAHGQCPAPTATRSSALSSRSLGPPSRTSRRHGCPPQRTPRHIGTHTPAYRLSRSSSKEASAEHNEAPITALGSLSFPHGQTCHVWAAPYAVPAGATQ